MEITEVKIYPVALDGRLRAYVSLIFDNSFIVREVKLVESSLGLFVSMPSRRKKDGSFKDIAHPLNNETRQMIEQKVIEAYKHAKETGVAAHPIDEIIDQDDTLQETSPPHHHGKK